MQKLPSGILNKPFKTGNKKIASELFEMYFSRTCVFANSIVNDHQQAYDIVQEAFINIWKKNIECKSVITFKVYLYNTVRNACLNYLQREFKQTTEVKENLNLEEAIDHMIIATEIESEILKHINLLPETRRNVILLKLKGLTMKEIAKELNLAVNTVKTHRKLAHKQLKDGLKDLYLFIL